MRKFRAALQCIRRNGGLNKAEPGYHPLHVVNPTGKSLKSLADSPWLVVWSFISFCRICRENSGAEPLVKSHIIGKARLVMVLQQSIF